MREIENKFVVYFDQQMGASHVDHCPKSFVTALEQVFASFSITNRKKEKRKEKKAQKFHKKTCIKGVI